MASIADVRPLFPAALAAPYFATNGYGVLPTPAAEALAAAAHRLSERGYAAHHKLETGVEAVRAQVAALVGGRADEIGFVRNTADAMGYAADALSFERGDEVVVFDDDYGTVVYPFLARQRREGDVSVRVAATDGGRVTADALEAALGPRTRAVATSWVRWDTGARADLAALGAVLAPRGVWFVVDAIQGLGAFPLDVEAARIDVLGAGCHKWQCGLAGLGVLFVRSALLDQLRPVRTGLNAQAAKVDADHTRDYPFAFVPGAARVEDGALNELAVHALGESLALLTSVGIDVIADHIDRLTTRLVDGWLERGGEVASPRGPGEGSGIVALGPTGRHGVDDLLGRLWAERILVGPQRGRLVPSIHLYTSDDDVERFLAAAR